MLGEQSTQVIANIEPVVSHGASWDDFLAWYEVARLRATGKEPAATTLRSKLSRGRTFASKAGLNGPAQVATLLSTQEGTEWAIELARWGVTSGTARSVAYLLRDICEWGISVGLCQTNYVTTALVPKPNPVRPIHIFTEAEIERLIAAAKAEGDVRWELLLTMAADTGARISEVLGLTYSDLWLDYSPPHIRLIESKAGPRLILLSERLVAMLTPELLQKLKVVDRNKDYQKDPRRYLFPAAYDSQRERLQTLCNRLGIPHGNWHEMRHGFATSQLAKGTPLHAVAKLLGHRSLSTTMRYSQSTVLSPEFQDYLK